MTSSQSRTADTRVPMGPLHDFSGPFVTCDETPITPDGLFAAAIRPERWPSRNTNSRCPSAGRLILDNVLDGAPKAARARCDPERSLRSIPIPSRLRRHLHRRRARVRLGTTALHPEDYRLLRNCSLDDDSGPEIDESEAERYATVPHDTAFALAKRC